MSWSAIAALIRQQTTASACALAVALALWTFPGHAGQSGAQFNVTVNLLSASSPTVFCRTNPGGLAFGATVTVVCSTGAVLNISPSRTGMPWAPMHGGAYRYILTGRDAGIPGTIDSYAGAGTTTSWRVIRLANVDYLELTIGW